ncbi:hypothetical protein C2E23DRAFT_781897 [Lenzites betulinus]|nr:hypothetical protein C2E23DRAFT_781897 [Lenzites betulinus]
MSAATTVSDDTAANGATQLQADSQHALAGSSKSNMEPSPPPASQHPPAIHTLDQADNILLLATHGIVVRDFAYENTLPPVSTVPRFSVQTQPRPRLLKRAREMLENPVDGEESDVEDPSIPKTWYIEASGFGVSRGSRYRKRTQALARTLTEPVDDVPPSQGLTTREGAFALPTSQCPSTPHAPHRYIQSTSLSPLTIADNTSPKFQASQQGESQETETWIDTPLVTPNGSLQWPLPAVQNTSAMPASQLESIFPQLPDEDMTLSQLGFSPERSQPHSQHSNAIASSSTGTPSRRRREEGLPPPANFRRRTSPSKSPSPPQPDPHGDTRPGSPRYYFRQRAPVAKANPKSTAGAGRASSRARASNQAARKPQDTAPPLRKKKKPSPPPAPELPQTQPVGRITRYGLRKNGDVEGVK